MHAEHRKRLRRTNAIESTFRDGAAAAAHHQGPASRAAGVATAYTFMDAAQTRWRRINGHELVALDRAGATSMKWRVQERGDSTDEVAIDGRAAGTSRRNSSTSLDNISLDERLDRSEQRIYGESHEPFLCCPGG